MRMPGLMTDNGRYDTLQFTFQMAVGDLVSNLRPHKSGLLQQERICIKAGLDYNRPWTRDASINVWNAAGLLFPEYARNTLLSVAGTNEAGDTVVIGQYWDKVIWGTGAWHYYLYTGDRAFLAFAHRVMANTLKEMEADEYNAETGLFRGAAVYGDGISAYPVRYTEREPQFDQNRYHSGIFEWVEFNPAKRVKQGYGLPVQALSTNCVYYNAYRLMNEMARALGQAPGPVWDEKAEKLKQAINTQLWSDSLGRYRYFADPWGGSPRQEGMGLAYALLFGVPDRAQAEQVFENTHICKAGIACVYPGYERYQGGGDHHARHSGTVWPHIQGFWALAAAQYGKRDIFRHEFDRLTGHAYRDKQFVELYHPNTGMPYGGMQEWEGTKKMMWFSRDRQTWSATAYLAMVLKGLAGMYFRPDGIRFARLMPTGKDKLEIINLAYRQAVLHIIITGKGENISSFKINGQETSEHFLPATATGNQRIEIRLGN